MTKENTKEKTKEKAKAKAKEAKRGKETKEKTMTIQSTRGPIVVENTMTGFMKFLKNECEREVRRTTREQ